MLNKASILNAKDARFQDEPVPEWGGDVRMYIMSGAGRQRYTEEYTKVREASKGKDDDETFQNFMQRLPALHALLLTLSLGDENGLLFTEEDIPKLLLKSSEVLDRMVEKVKILNGLSSAKNAVETEVKNSEAGANADSGSTSPSP